MIPPNDELLALQPDLYQRYELLRRIVADVRERLGWSHVRVVDVGSGASRLTEIALGPDAAVTRADVIATDDPEVVRIEPGEPLPFADDDVDVVVAMDVLEHVDPPMRERFIAECARVARALVVIACPVADQEIERAERTFAHATLAMSGEPTTFLEEHEALGLPAEPEVLEFFASHGLRALAIPNAPLTTWATANLIDYAVNLRLGPGEVKASVNRLVNDRSSLSPTTGPTYRRFFIASPDASFDVGELAAGIRTGPESLDDLEVALIAVERLAAELARVSGEAELQQRQIAAHDQVVHDLAAGTAALELRLASESHRVVHLQRLHDDLVRARASLEEQLHRARESTAADAREHGGAPEPAPTDRRHQVDRVARAVRNPVRSAVRAARSEAARVQRRLELGIRHHEAPELFDPRWYLDANPDVAAAGADPWRHYREYGHLEGRAPHPLFDASFYIERYGSPDGEDPFLDYARHIEPHRDPNAYFDVAWYLDRNPDVAAAGVDPVAHYWRHGWREGRRPSPLFDPAWYNAQNPHVAAAGLEPLVHFLQHGSGEGRHANHLALTASQGWYRPAPGLIPWFTPMSFVVSVASTHPRLNVLLPTMASRQLTGGPNTVIQLAYRLAAGGLAVRFIATDLPLDDDVEPLWAHMAAISGVGRRLPNVEVVDGSDRSRPVEIGEQDLFLATAWWTAQIVKSALPLVRQQRFLYMIQDFEPLFFASSSQYALALETYALDHVPIVNSRFLLEHLAAQGVGRFADPSFVERALVFEPTVDRNLFRPAVPTTATTRRRLLFYARPVNGLRNLFELGVAAIQLAIQQGTFDEQEWEFVGMGDPFEPLAVGPESVLRPAPWLGLDGYAAQMRDSDVLLSLMLAPHPSYPPLEMASCGGVAVTTTFGPKTAERMAAISANIIATEATIEDVAAGMGQAVRRLEDVPGRLRASRLDLPDTWDDVFAELVPQARAAVDELASDDGGSTARTPDTGYGRWRADRILERASEIPAPQLGEELTFSLLTAVWNTDPSQLRTLAASVLDQDVATNWEWVVVDNGSSDAGTRQVLEEIGRDPRVTIHRNDSNLGILGGMRSCLELSNGRYVVHVDHDDVLTPDAVRVVAASLAAHGWPRAFYTDEDKVQGAEHLQPYFKPDWDPVLFVNSCYIAHLCGIDRELALELDAYLDPYTEASPDWDLFMRALTAGEVPLHVPEVVYSWRIHPTSTAGNPMVKPAVVATHRRVLERFVASAPGGFERYSIEIHPDGPEQIDWWIRRRRVDPAPLLTVVLGDDVGRAPFAVADVDQAIASIGLNDRDGLAALASRAVAEGRLVHLGSGATASVRDGWYWEALGLLELHPDAVAVGGPVVCGGRIVSAGDVIGFGRGLDSPAEGEPAHASGWLRQNLKQHTTDGVRADHAVVRPQAILDAIATFEDATPAAIGWWLALDQAARGGRIVYSPILRATVTAPVTSRVSDRERAQLARLAQCTTARTAARSPWLGLDARTATAPQDRATRARHLARLSRTPVPAAASYADELDARLRERAGDFALPPEPASVSVLTPVYIGTDDALFGELHAALAAQDHPFHSWVIGRDGPISANLERRLRDLAADDPRILVVELPKRGIIPTMRSCLEHAAGDYVVPIDADDIVTPDALRVLASVVGRNGRPGLVYSDEAILDGGIVRDPYVRPDWDPVLHVSSSYIWHAICYARDIAMAAGVYTEPNAEWCQDWDTVERIRQSGQSIVHVPEVLYFWRRHEHSSTNSAAPTQDQARSVTALLQRIADHAGMGDRLVVEPFPLWRGAPELHLRRVQQAQPDTTLVVLGPFQAWCRESLARTSTMPFVRVIEGPTIDEPASALLASLETLPSPYVMTLAGDLLLGGHEWAWEALKWFELIPDVACVTGRLTTASGLVTAVDGDPDGSLCPVDRPGPYAKLLKPRSAGQFDVSFALHRTAALMDAIRQAGAGARLGDLRAVTPGSRIVLDPLLVSLDPQASAQN